MKNDYEFKMFVTETSNKFEQEYGKKPKISYEQKCLPFTDEMKAFIKAHWSEVRQKWPKIYNDKLYHVVYTNSSESNIVFHTINSNYMEYVGTRVPEFRKSFGGSCIVNPLSVGLLVVTADGKIPIGRREFVDTWKGFYSTVAGYVQHPKKPRTPPDINKTITQELLEEAAIAREEISNMSFLGSSGNSYLIYEVAVRTSFFELTSRKPTEIEFSKLEFVEKSAKSLKNFIKDNRLRIMPGCLASLIYFGLRHFGRKWGLDLVLV